MTETLQLYSYWRSSAAYRVRIGLNLKGLAHSIVPVHLLRRGQVHEIKMAMEDSLQEGMQSFDQCLFRLYKDGRIEMEEALKAADSRDGLALKFRLSEGGAGDHDPYADVFGGSQLG